MLHHALAYQKIGWSVIPIHPKKKIPRIKWAAYQKKLPTEQQITKWWTQWPDSNIGGITGPLSNICYLDFDSVEAREALSYQYDLPNTLIQKTGRGYHYIFKYPDTPIKSQTGLADKVDFKGKNGIIVLAPSYHSSGKQYRWLNINPIEYGLDDLLPLPPDLELFIRNGSPQRPQDRRSQKTDGKTPAKGKDPHPISTSDPDWVNKALFLGVKKGLRDWTAFRLASKMVGNDIPKEQIITTLLLWNKNNKPPLPDETIKLKVESAEKYRGKSKFGDFIQKKISNFVKIVSPVGDHIYQMTVENNDKKLSFRLSPTQLYTSRQFAIQLMAQCDVVIDPPKQKDWNVHVRELIKHQEIVYEREDATDLDFIRTEICRSVDQYKDEEYNAKEEFMKGGKAIKENGILYVRSKEVAKILRLEGIFKNPREIVHLLRSMGFEDHQFGQERVKCWKIDYTKFKAGLSQ